MEAIDVMTVHILELTAEVPYYAATVARARLTRAYKQLSTALASLDSTEGGGWPGKPSASLPLLLTQVLLACPLSLSQLSTSALPQCAGPPPPPPFPPALPWVFHLLLQLSLSGG